MLKVLVESAGAIAFAALRRLIQLRKANKDESIVLIVSMIRFEDSGDADKPIDNPVIVDIMNLEFMIARS